MSRLLQRRRYAAMNYLAQNLENRYIYNRLPRTVPRFSLSRRQW
jgi:hypothetical protein